MRLPDRWACAEQGHFDGITPVTGVSSGRVLCQEFGERAD